jgi:hypothetical protein
MPAAELNDGAQIAARAGTVGTSAQMQFNSMAVFGSQGAVNQIAN